MGWVFGDKEEIIIRFRNATTPRSPGGANKHTNTDLCQSKQRCVGLLLWRKEQSEDHWSHTWVIHDDHHDGAY